VSAGKLAILDRDGVINFDSAEYIKGPDEWIPIPSSLAAFGDLTRAGWRIAVVSNQSGIARGMFGAEAVEATHRRMLAAVSANGGRIDGIYYCPHLPEAGCVCRKPAPGLLIRAAEELGFEAADTVLVGDKKSDLEAAWAFGARAVLVQSGIHEVKLTAPESARVVVFPDLAAAVAELLHVEGV
jgi:D-glycero-D-manno-heptose 1,7-bisphosphate phosphatase